MCFLIGSAYFVIGSYPEGSQLVDADVWDEAGAYSRDNDGEFSGHNPFFGSNNTTGTLGSGAASSGSTGGNADTLKMNTSSKAFGTSGTGIGSSSSTLATTGNVFQRALGTSGAEYSRVPTHGDEEEALHSNLLDHDQLREF